MKLMNKKTGEIRPAEAREDGIYLYYETTEQWYKYELDFLAKWWEYYEKPKERWAIDQFGEPINVTALSRLQLEKLRQYGNDFESEEEAKKAVEKLKAWKRLKDGGFVFCGKGDCLDTIKFDYGPAGYNNQDFAILFGGEE